VKLTFSKDTILLNKSLNGLDRFVLKFTKILEQKKIRCVLISGYVVILLGRNRTSEDVDMFVEQLDYERFKDLWNTLTDEFECINTPTVDDAYNEYITKGTSLRFSKKGTFIPNIEFKFPKTQLDTWTLAERKSLLLNGKQLFISPLELQVSYKLFLGSEKDIEDAKYLYDLTKEHLDPELFDEFNTKLKTTKLFRKYLL
jgi:predicted nucleotidyltransferase